MLRPNELALAANVPPSGCSIDAAQKYTRWLATHHYENFNVVSWLLPKELHQHFYNVYAYCRWADNLGDEIPDGNRAVELLDWWESELNACYDDKPSHAVFIALRETVLAQDIPKQPFADLLKAFRQDQFVKRYPNWDAVMDYCVSTPRIPLAASFSIFAVIATPSASIFPTALAPRSSSQISGRTSRAISKKAASTSRSTSPPLTKSPKPTSSRSVSPTPTRV